MSARGDDDTEMPRHPPLDDAAIEAFLAGNAAAEELAPLVGFVEDLHNLTSGPAPVPSPQLAAMLASGSTAGDDVPATASRRDPVPVPQVAGGSWTRRRKRRIGELIAGLGVAAKAVFGVGVAAAAVTAGGAAGVLPGPAQHLVSTGVAAVTPFSFPDGAKPRGNVGGTAGTGVDQGGGPTPATTGAAATGAGGGGGPAAPAQNGPDLATTTPAGGQVPTSVPAGTPFTPAPEPSTVPGRSGSTPGADHTPTSHATGPPASTPATSNNGKGKGGRATTTSTPAADHQTPAQPKANAGRP